MWSLAGVCGVEHRPLKHQGPIGPRIAGRATVVRALCHGAEDQSEDGGKRVIHGPPPRARSRGGRGRSREGSRRLPCALLRDPLERPQALCVRVLERDPVACLWDVPNIDPLPQLRQHVFSLRVVHVLHPTPALVACQYFRFLLTLRPPCVYHRGMGRRKNTESGGEPNKPASVKVAPEVLTRLDALADAGAYDLPGRKGSRSDAHRACLLAGLRVEEERMAGRGGGA